MELSRTTVLEPIAVDTVDTLPKPKHPGGAPKKITKQMAEEIALLLSHGIIEEKVCEILKITRVTLWNAKKSPEFFNTVLGAKENADREVVKSLFQSAVGYSHPDEKVFVHEGELIVHKTTKHYPPNVGAATLWLINRQRQAWRKEIQHEENNKTKPPMIRLFSKIDGKEAARIKQTGDQISVLLGDDFVASVTDEGKSGNSPR